VTAEAVGRRRSPAPAVLLAGLIALSFALRFYRLGAWGFDSDETFTLRDSLHLRLSNPRPVFYLLNHYVVQPLVPLNEFGLRLLAALFGVLAVPALYFVVRRLAGTRAALFAALLLAVSPLHVYYSQFARYWSLVFLLSAIYPYALYIGIRQRDRRALALGAVTMVLAVLSHPASVLLVGSLALWAGVTYLPNGQLGRLWSQPRVRWSAVAGLVLVLAVAVRFVPMLQNWIRAHDTRQLNTEFLLHLPDHPVEKQLAYLLSFAESLTLPLVLAAVLGIYLLWLGRDRPLALLLVCLFLVPAGFLVVLSFRAPVSTFYLVPTTPVFFIGAGVLLDRLADVEWELRPRWLLSAAVTTMIVAAGAPTLMSQYLDGRRYDFKSVAQWLSPQLAPGDVLFSDQPKVLEFYLPGKTVEYLRGDPAPLAQSVRTLQSAGGEGALWLILPASAHAFRTNPKLGGLKGWIYEHCQLRNTIGVGRVDFRQFYLQIYRCPAAAGEAAGTHSE
jgi:mannosyltransferase